MLDWIFDGIARWIASTVTGLMDAVSALFLTALGTDMTAMEEYFPFVTKAFEIMQYTAWAVLFLITAWQLFRVFGGPVTEAENPWTLLARAAIFSLMIGYAKQIFLLALDIARVPYWSLVSVTMTADDFTFAGLEGVLSSGLTTIVSVVSGVGAILLLILEIALGWNYFKLLLETVERYVVVGVLCYTSPLAFCMGASKATSNVFRSWCRMVGSQLLLLVMNVWFLRAFNSSVGQYVANGGALTNGMGNIFLWLFCALAFLKTAQKFDSYLASMGLNVAQTGSSMGMELLMAARVISGVGGGRGGTAGNIFKGTSSAASGAAGAAGAAGGGFLGSFANKFKGNSYVRDAVVTGGTRMGANGPAGFVARAFGGMAARNGATLNSNSISSVAARSPVNSGTIGGDIADRSLINYMPQLGEQKLSGTTITGGHISTNVVGADGKLTPVAMSAASQFDRPDVPHTVVTAADGSTWYQMASGDGAGSFYDAPNFTGSPAEAGQVAASFPDAPEGTTLRTVGDGVVEATNDEGSTLWYNSAFYDEPDAPHTTMQAANGTDWYVMQPHAATPDFEPVSGSGTPIGAGYDSHESGTPGGYGAPGTDVPMGGVDPSGGGTPMGSGTAAPGDGGSGADSSAAAFAYNRAQFQQFMPGYEERVTSVDGSYRSEGRIEVRHENGSGTMFYDTTQYAPPRGDYKVYEDRNGSQWYAVRGDSAVERKPVYEHGKPVYDGDKLRTTNVETVRYRSTPSRYTAPAKRKPEIKAPKRKR